MRQAGVISPDSQRKLKDNNWCFSQNAGVGSKIPSDFSGKLWAGISPRITASWAAAMNVVSCAMILTCSVEGTKGAWRLWNKGIVWDIRNLSCMLKKRASQWLSSTKSKPRTQSAPEDLKTRKCCWHRLLASDIGRITVPEKGDSAKFAADSRQWAGWSWFWKVTRSSFKNHWLKQDTLAAVSQTAVIEELQTSTFTEALLLSLTELRVAGPLVRQKGSTAQPRRPCVSCFSLNAGTDCGFYAQNVPCTHIWCRLYNLWSQDFWMATLALFRGVDARTIETHPILGFVRLTAIGGVTSAFFAIFLVSVPMAALALNRVVVGLRLLQSSLLVGFSPLRHCCGGPLCSSTTRLICSLMLRMKSEKSSLGDGERPVKMFTDAPDVSGCWPWRFK